MTMIRSIGRLRDVRVKLAVPVLLAGVLGGAGAANAVDTTPGTAPPPWGRDGAAGSCVVCHSLEEGGTFRVAPNLYGIVGAEKGRARNWYTYSPALLAKGGTWSETDLDQFLEDAGKFAPGSTKSIRVRDAEERRRIIDFLKTLKSAG